MDSMSEHISLEEFVASVHHQESKMTMHHLETVPTGTTESSLTVPTHNSHATMLESPSSTESSIDKSHHSGKNILYIKIVSDSNQAHRWGRAC